MLELAFRQIVRKVSTLYKQSITAFDREIRPKIDW